MTHDRPGPRRCVVVGDVMMDISAVIESDVAYASDTPARIAIVPGGVACNTAAWMASTGAPVTLVGSVGPDAFGRSIREHLTGLGVDVHLREGVRATGACVVIVDQHRERTMFPDPGANAEITLTDVISVLGADTHLHLSGYTLMNPDTRDVALQAAAHARLIGATLSLDPASADPLRQHLALMRSLLAEVDVVIANEAEATVLTGQPGAEAALIALREVVPCAVVKRGPRGVVAAGGNDRVTLAAPAVEVRDTTGAGDAFTAGFLPSWLRGDPLPEAVAAGQGLAGVCVSRVGASPWDP